MSLYDYLLLDQLESTDTSPSIMPHAKENRGRCRKSTAEHPACLLVLYPAGRNVLQQGPLPAVCSAASNPRCSGRHQTLNSPIYNTPLKPL